MRGYILQVENKWADTFYYDPTSPSCLRWARESYNGRSCGRLHKRIGDVAGSLNGNGQWEVWAENRLQQSHRIIYEIHHGPIPDGMLIDHIDGNRSNNVISNLRVVDYRTNARNRKKSVKNTTGETGVYIAEKLDKDGTVTMTYVAVVQELGGYKRRSGRFIVNKLGLLEAFAMAVQWRRDQIALLNTQGAGYTDDHGTR